VLDLCLKWELVQCSYQLELFFSRDSVCSMW
jgi:hypothetical protein